MQFTYQFPEMVERLVLVSSGGLGPEVSLVLRAAALPGADLFISRHRRPRPAGRLRRSAAAWEQLGLRPSADVAEVARGYASLADPERRKAFLATLRSVVGTDGQRVAAVDRLYLAEALPLLIVWGARDPIIPVAHGEDAHASLPGSRLEIFDGVGHLPQLEAPGRFVPPSQRFLAETEPAQFDRGRVARAVSGGLGRGQVLRALVQSDRFVLGEVADEDDPAADLEEGAFAEVGREPDRSRTVAEPWLPTVR